MSDECHALLKSVCALKRVPVSTYVYDLIAVDFEDLVNTDDAIYTLFVNGNYPEGSRAQALKEKIQKHKGA